MAVIHEIRRAMQPLANTVQGLISRVVVSGIRWAPKLATAQLRGLFGEVLEGVEHFGHYGFASYPKEGAEGIVLRVLGDSSHTVLIATADRRYKIDLAEGEVALSDDLGQKVHLKRSGIEIDTPGKVDITAAGAVNVIAAGDATVSGVDVEIDAAGDATINAGGVVNLGGTGGAAIVRHGDLDDQGHAAIATSTKVFAN